MGSSAVNASSDVLPRGLLLRMPYLHLTRHNLRSESCGTVTSKRQIVAVWHGSL